MITALNGCLQEAEHWLWMSVQQLRVPAADCRPLRVSLSTAERRTRSLQIAGTNMQYSNVTHDRPS